MAARRRGLLGTVADFLVEPSATLDEAPETAWSGAARPVIAVAGLGARSGVTTVARALGAELSLRDPEGAAVVTSGAIAGGGIPLGTAAAGRLAQALSRSVHARTRAVGRVCLAETAIDDQALVETARGLAPLVLDVAEPSQTARAAAVSDAVVLLGLPDVEPALATVLSDSLRRVGPEPVVVLNRDLGCSERWEGSPALRLPDSRLGAQLALAGREPRGELGRAIARLADMVAGQP